MKNNIDTPRYIEYLNENLEYAKQCNISSDSSLSKKKEFILKGFSNIFLAISTTESMATYVMVDKHIKSTVHFWGRLMKGLGGSDAEVVILIETIQSLRDYKQKELIETTHDNILDCYENNK